MKKFKFSLILFIFLVVPFFVWPKETKFAVVSDIHKAQDSWLNCLNELQRQGSDVILETGDMAPDSDRYIDFENVFYAASKIPVFLPVPGNHELDDGMENYEYMRDKILPQIRGIVRHDVMDCDYYYDYNQVRFIAVDGYVWSGAHGVINDAGREWVKQAIKTAPPAIEDIFIFLHEPPYPQVRHVGDSFDEDPALRDRFWQMLAQSSRVRAVFVGHTHYYYRSEHDRVWQVSSGSIGNNKEATFVAVTVDETGIKFKAYKAQNGKDAQFSPFDEWESVNSLTTLP
jgi:predicted phosphodiesterase